jgi:hypothetical protein
VPLRLLVFVGLRVYAISFIVQAVALVPLYIQLMSHDAKDARGPWIFLEPIGMILTALVLWTIAGRLATQVVGKSDPMIDRFSITLETAYTFAFVFLGLYFVLSSIASTLQQLYYLVAVVAQLPATDPQRSLAFFQFYRPCFTFIAGLTSLIGAPFWSSKLIAIGSHIRS